MYLRALDFTLRAGSMNTLAAGLGACLFWAANALSHPAAGGADAYQQGLAAYPTNSATAYAFFSQAVAAGHVEAMMAAGYCLENGHGTPENRRLAYSCQYYGVQQDPLAAAKGLAVIESLQHGIRGEDLDERCARFESKATDADAAYAYVVELLRAGKQADAEDMLERAIVKFPPEARLLFTRGVLARSRWDKLAARIYFTAVQALEDSGPFASAAAVSMEMDDKKGGPAGLAALRELSANHPDNLFFRWLFAIQCREQRQLHAEGARAYEYILEQWKPGPVMVHHTYANILTESLDRPEDALPHRETALELAPRGWTYQGMANTLKELKRLDEACAAFATAVELDPKDPDYTRQWAWALYDSKRFEEAVEAFDRAIELEPANMFNHKTRAKCLSRLKRAEEAAAGYERAHALGCKYSAGYLAALHYRGINCTPNEELGLKWARIAAEERNSQLGLTILIEHYGSNAVPEKNDAEKSLYYADKLMAKESVTPVYFDDAAAAYARAGKFEKAIELQRRFIEHYSGDKYRRLRESATSRLELYRQEKPYPPAAVQ